MTELRRRMIQSMLVHGLAARTQQTGKTSGWI